MSEVEMGSVPKFLKTLRHYRLVFACIVLVLCFAVGNDLYAANAVTKRHKDLLNGPRQVVDSSEAARRKMAEKTFGSDLSKRYLIDPKAAKQQNMLALLSRAADSCNQISSFISNLPFSEDADAGATTVGATDNYDISGDPQACPHPTCQATSGNFNDRGYTYAGTGTGPDVAYSIAFTLPTSLEITVDPLDVGTEQNPIGDDLAIIVYGAVCSNSSSDAIVLADNAADGNPPDLADNSEKVTFSLLPPGAYNIVVDAYTSAGAVAPTAGPYSISVKCLESGPCAIPAYRRRAR